jgi:hypothetical protein
MSSVVYYPPNRTRQNESPVVDIVEILLLAIFQSFLFNSFTSDRIARAVNLLTPFFTGPQLRWLGKIHTHRENL